MADQSETPGPSVPTPPKSPTVNVHKPLNNSLVTQGFIAMVSFLPSVISGGILGYTALSMWDLPLSYRNSTWFASLAALGAAAGCLVAQPMINGFGVRGTTLLSHVICLIGWLMAASSSATTNFLIGRLLTGGFVGLVSVTARSYSAECFPDRPSARPAVYTALGVLLVYLAGALISYAQTATVAVLATVASFLMIRTFVPESPAWLESRGRTGDAEYARLRLRLQSADGPAAAAVPGLDFVRSGPGGRPFLALCLYFALQQLSGPLVLIAYAPQLVNDSGVRLFNSRFVAVVMAAFLVGGSLVAAAMRHPQSAATLASAGTAASGLVIVAYGLLRRLFFNRLGSQLFSVVPLLAVVAYMTFSCTALVPDVPIANAPGEHVAVAFGYAVAFAVIRAYPYARALMGWWTFALFAVAAGLNVFAGLLTFSEPESDRKSRSSDRPAV